MSMYYVPLPKTVTSSFIKELYELPTHHRKYKFDLLFSNRKTSAESLKKSKENIELIEEHGYSFLFALENLNTIMHYVEPEFFKPILTKAALVMQDPTKINREEFRAEFNKLKKQVDEYKTAHPFSTGLGYILGTSLALTLGIALVILSAVPIVIPGIIFAVSQALVGFIGIITTIATSNMLSDNASMHYGFFKNKYVENSESFVNDIASDDYEEYLEHAKQFCQK